MASEMNDYYQYSRIRESRTIRLILLQPDPDLDAPVRCSLLQISLDECEYDITEQYIALSYVWGDATLSCSISIDQTQLDITASLDCALRHIRHQTKVLRLWADGICINQTSIEDRNQQVRLMGSIYALAQHTIIFLGPSTSETESALRYIVSERSLKSKPIGRSQVRSRNKWSLVLKSTILAHAWFTRVWALQEFVLSRDPWIQCGTVRVKWNLFCETISLHLHPRDPLISNATRMNKIAAEHRQRSLSQARSFVGDGTGDDAETQKREQTAWDNALLDILLTRRGAGVTDHRDMLFGHFALLPRLSRPPLGIDYSKSIAQVYTAIARHFIQVEGLKFVQHVETTRLRSRRDDLSSWVPNWTKSTKTRPSTNFNGNHCLSSSMSHILFVYGEVFGRINHIIQEPDWDYTNWVEDIEMTWSKNFGGDKRMDFGPLDYLRGASSAVRTRIVQTRLKDAPETLLDVHKAICARFYDDIHRTRIQEFGDASEGDLYVRDLANRYFMSMENMPSHCKEILAKFSRILHHMSRTRGLSESIHRPGDMVLATLDTGGYIWVPRVAQVGDEAFTLDRSDTVHSFMLLRRVRTEEAASTEKLLAEDDSVLDLSERVECMVNPLLYKLVSSDYFPKDGSKVHGIIHEMNGIDKIMYTKRAALMAALC